MTGVPASSLFDAMTARNIPTRSWRNSGRTNPPYGYAWLSGKVVVNPIEYKVVLLILELLKAGKRPHHIATYLNERQISPRRGKKWFARTITDIVHREGSGQKPPPS